MKPSEKKLGLEIQLFLLRHGYQVEDLAAELGVTGEGLSNLIHGRRRFRDETLARLADTAMFKAHGFSLQRLRALRALDEYDLEELVRALLEAVRQGAVDALPPDALDRLRREFQKPEYGLATEDKKRALLELMRANPT